MKTLKELKNAISNKTPLLWNDPDPIYENDYTIFSIKSIDEEEFDENYMISIQYNNGMSEAQVFLHEILVKNN